MTSNQTSIAGMTRSMIARNVFALELTAAILEVDGLYLWAEVDRLKSQVQDLQTGAKATRLEQTRIVNYVHSFTTHAQLDAAMSTRVSIPRSIQTKLGP